jgi:membrane-associated phospholipid phosphatase
VPFLLLTLVSAMLATWALLRRRRILAADGRTAAGLEPHAAVARSPAWPTVRSRPRPRLSAIGLNPLGRRLLALNAIVLATDVFFFSIRGLSLDWSTAWLGAVLLAALFIVWLNFYVVPGPREEWFVAEALFVVLLIILVTNVASPMQYGAVAMGAPYVDWWLAAADARLGVSVAAMAAWTRAHGAVALLALLAYASLLPQFVFAVVALAALRDRERLWEFAFHFHACLVVTVAALTIFPAVCPPAYYGFAPTIDMTRLIGQIKGFHDGSLTVVKFDELEGLVSFPSFHVAGGLIVTWAFRRRTRILVPLLALNAALVASTVVTGVHYLVDVIATLPLCAASLAAYHWWGRSLVSGSEPA